MQSNVYIFVLSGCPDTFYGNKTTCCASDVDIFHKHNAS